MERRTVLSAAILGGIGAIVHRFGAEAQFTEQEILQGADVVSTGNVEINQSASNEAFLTINGTPITEDGVYQTNQGQVIVQNGRVVSTGDVSINQQASNQSHNEIVYPEYDGQDVTGYCVPGSVLANPDTGQVFYQGRDCCWYAACANRCRTGCEGDTCS
jgi:hypothetical protein